MSPGTGEHVAKEPVELQFEMSLIQTCFDSNMFSFLLIEVDPGGKETVQNSQLKLLNNMVAILCKIH